MQVWVVFTPRQTYLDGDLVIPKVFASERAATVYWKEMSIKLSTDLDEQNKKGDVFRPGRPDLRISEQEI